MDILNWRAKRQIFYLAIFAALALAILGAAIFWFSSEPTCFDGRKNQKEEEIDCGGPCGKKCAGETKNPAVLWSRAIKTSDGIYDAAALVENPNIFAGIQSLPYKFKLYDQRNVLVGVREGEIFVNPAERFMIFEPGIVTKEKIPARAVLEMAAKEEIDWVRIEKNPPNFSVEKKTFYKDPFPFLEVKVHNRSLTSFPEVYVNAVIYDKDNNVQAASQTVLDAVEPDALRFAFFTWQKPFEKEAEIIEIFLRANQTEF
ncbi:MAG: hypothetical protein AAB564_02585 [Patescibacteria group bacterium]